GIVFATAITLVLVPSAYVVHADLERLNRRHPFGFKVIGFAVLGGAIWLYNYLGGPWPEIPSF
ncbi:MAG: hypothetical protein KDB07_10685, partial [Planctomycetes bacterium]|nr:hypothetical protein [Planctomycetota bacterium]